MTFLQISKPCLYSDRRYECRYFYRKTKKLFTPWNCSSLKLYVTKKIWILKDLGNSSLENTLFFITLNQLNLPFRQKIFFVWCLLIAFLEASLNILAIILLNPSIAAPRACSQYLSRTRKLAVWSNSTESLL